MSLEEPTLTPPGAWHQAHSALRRAQGSIEHFLHIQASSGIVLAASAALALIWANTSLSPYHHAVFEAPIGITLGSFSVSVPLRFVIDDVLMVIFFFVVGLEIKRELAFGELADFRRAALPVAAALGGMIAPACIYLAINGGTAASRGFGIPTATDIAFAVGALTLLGKRVPPALRVLLLALAVIDDIGAIVVIALFYSSKLRVAGLVVAMLAVLVIALMKRFGVRRAFAYAPAAVVVWWGVHHAGVHATIAGVIVGLMTPARAWYGKEGFVTVAEREMREIARGPDEELPDRLDAIERARREALPPAEALQRAYHPWVAFVVMPLFALSSAAVPLTATNIRGDLRVALGIAAGLMLGKPIGIVCASMLAVKTGLATAPRGVTLRGLVLVGCVAGIGFTMSLFISGLAFADPARLAVAKLAVLLASIASSLLAYLLGRAFLLRGATSADIAITESAAERSAET